jgi:hypothetical protein
LKYFELQTAPIVSIDVALLEEEQSTSIEFGHTDLKPRLFLENRIGLQRRVFVTTSHMTCPKGVMGKREARPLITKSWIPFGEEHTAI